MNARERVKRVLNFMAPDRIPVFDLVENNDAVKQDFDIVLINNLDEEGEYGSNKFRAKSIMDPFEDISSTYGLQNILGKIAEDKAFVETELKRSLHKILKRLSILGDYNIDGIWLWSDIAYDKGLFFSYDFYLNNIFPMHKTICAFFEERNLPVIFHSDGNLNGIMPYLIEAGFKGVHPVESNAGMDLRTLMNIYNGKIAFLGGFKLDLLKSGDESDLYNLLDEILETVNEHSGYIFGFDSLIKEDIDIYNYGKIVDFVRQYPLKSSQSVR